MMHFGQHQASSAVLAEVTGRWGLLSQVRLLISTTHPYGGGVSMAPKGSLSLTFISSISAWMVSILAPAGGNMAAFSSHPHSSVPQAPWEDSYCWTVGTNELRTPCLSTASDFRLS